MQISVRVEELARVLKATAPVMNPKERSVGYAHVQIEVGTGGCSATAYDGKELGIQVSFAAEVTNPGRIVLPHRELLLELRGVAKTEEVSVSAEPGARCQLRWGGRQLTLQGVAPETVAGIPALEGPTESRGAIAGLPGKLAQVQHAMSTDVTRYNLRGVCLDEIDERFYVAATDRHRLAFVVDDEQVPFGRQVILPAAAAMAISQICGPEEALELVTTKTHATLSRPGLLVYARLIEGVFVSFLHVVPECDGRQLTARRLDLLKAVKAVTRFKAKGGAPYLTLKLNGALEICATDPDRGDCTESLPYPLERGESLTFGVNGNYLVDALEAHTADEVQCFFQDDLAPCVIKSQGDLTSVIMPVRF